MLGPLCVSCVPKDTSRGGFATHLAKACSLQVPLAEWGDVGLTRAFQGGRRDPVPLHYLGNILRDTHPPQEHLQALKWCCWPPLPGPLAAALPPIPPLRW